MEYPYINFQGTKIEKILNAAIADLIANNDLKLITNESYISGYIASQLQKKNLLKKEALNKKSI